MEERFSYRFVFSKTDRAVFISHLDLMRAMQRAFKRARLPIWHTKGYSPHAYIMFPLALSLGVESHCEIMDADLTAEIPADEVLKRLNAALPEGLKIERVGATLKPHTEIAGAEYEIITDAEMLEINNFLSRESIEITKLNKKKIPRIVDIKPDINVISKEEIAGGTRLVLRLPAGGTRNLNPSVFMTALSDFSERKLTARVKRLRILDADGNDFA